MQGTTYCDINAIFDTERTCTINTQTANQEIIEGLNTAEYRELLINSVNARNTIDVSEGNEIFSIITSELEEKIQLGSCEGTMRAKYHIENENKIIYIDMKSKKHIT